MTDTALRRFLRRLKPGGDPIERCVPDVRHDIFHAFVAMYRFARPLARGRRVLDAGCGAGFGARYLAEHGAGHVAAVDVESRAIEYARRHFAHPRVEHHVITGNRFPAADGAFDLVFSSNVIEHVADHLGHLREIKRVLKPGGSLLLVTPVVEISGQSDHPYHVTNLTPEEWRAVLSEHFREVGMFGVYLRAAPQHSVPWQLTPLVQRLAVHPMYSALETPVRTRISRDVMFNPFGLWEGDFEVERCEATMPAMNASMAFVAICRDEAGPDWSEFEMRREPRLWSESDLALARCWRDLRRTFASHWAALTDEPVPEDAAWCPPPELWGARRLRGEFDAPRDCIAGLRINFATFARTNSGTVNVALRSESGGELACASVRCEALRDGAFHDVRFAAPVSVRPGEHCTFDLWSNDGRTGNAVTAWTRYDCARFEPGVALCDARGGWGGVVHEVLCE